MKRLLPLALCAIFALDAGARTLYVDARRPNNKGNALSAKKAKKTIQAAINVAKKGDTILVFPGAYTPIKTNNKKIAIKSAKGQKKTSIVHPKSASNRLALAQLGRTWKTTYIGTGAGEPLGQPYTVDSHPDSKGTKTTLSGFLLDGLLRGKDYGCVYGVSGGTVRSCTIQRIGNDGATVFGCAARHSKLALCVIRSNRCIGSGLGFVSDCVLQSCRLSGNSAKPSQTWIPSTEFVNHSTVVDSLIVSNTTFAGRDAGFWNSTFVNCSISDNTFSYEISGEANLSEGSKFYNCILRNNYSQRLWSEYETVDKSGPHEEYGYFDRNGTWVRDEDEDDGGYVDDEGSWIDYDYQYRTVSGPYTTEEWVKHTGPKKLHNVDAGNVYKNTDTTNKNPKFVNAAKGNYKLKKGSYCIDKGKLTKAQKKLVGTKDLAGKKRIRGKAIDRGCYEY